MTWRSELLQTDMLLTNDCLAQSLFLPRADSGTFSVPGRVSPGRGTNGLDSGTSRAIRDRWQPYILVTVVKESQICYELMTVTFFSTVFWIFDLI